MAQRKERDGLVQATPASTGWKTALRNLFSIDPRSLAVFRVAMGLLLLADLAIRTTDLNVMYTDQGMFPRSVICFHYTTIWNWSFHFGSGLWGYQAMLFGIAAALALALLAGFETRLAAIGSWLMLVSLHHRVPPILSGADILMRMLLFWAMFLPLERVWSLDRWLERRRGTAATQAGAAPVLSVASAAILIQLALMYLFSAIFKSNVAWTSGTAVAAILANDFFASPLGAHLLRFPWLMAGMTWGAFFLEWAAPLLLFIPKGTARVRVCAIAALAAMHVGIAVCMEVDLFSPVALAGLSLFLPAEFWNSRLLARFSPASENVRPVVAAAGQRSAKESPALFYLTQGACSLLLIYVILMNINTLPSHPLSRQAPVKKGFFWTACGLSQKWGMFDEPPSKNGWYVAWAKLRDGSDVDLLRRGAALGWQRPNFPAGMFPNYRWRKCFREMIYADELGYQVYRAPVAEFLCRDWNARNPADKQIAQFDLIYCLESDAQAANSSSRQLASREQLVHLDMNEP